MKKIYVITLVMCSFGAVYFGGFKHFKYVSRNELDYIVLYTEYWSELTNINDVWAALDTIKRDENPKLYDNLARSYCRSAANIFHLREQMKPDYWRLKSVDKMLSNIPKFLADNPSMTMFVYDLSDSQDTVASHRQDTYKELFKTLDIEIAEQDSVNQPAIDE